MTQTGLAHEVPRADVQLPPVFAVRGSLLASSIESLREAGYYDRYQHLLEPAWKDAVLFCLASSWAPVEVAMAHYAACERLELSESAVNEVAEVVSARIMDTFLGTMLRASRTLGITPSPWIPLHQYNRVCSRLLQGGTFAMRETGPKDAVIENSGIPMLRFRYFRSAMVGLTRGAASLFAVRCCVKEIAWPGEREHIRISARWL